MGRQLSLLLRDLLDAVLWISGQTVLFSTLRIF